MMARRLSAAFGTGASIQSPDEFHPYPRAPAIGCGTSSQGQRRPNRGGHGLCFSCVHPASHGISFCFFRLRIPETMLFGPIAHIRSRRPLVSYSPKLPKNKNNLIKLNRFDPQSLNSSSCSTHFNTLFNRIGRIDQLGSIGPTVRVGQWVCAVQGRTPQAKKQQKNKQASYCIYLHRVYRPRTLPKLCPHFITPDSITPPPPQTPA